MSGNVIPAHGGAGFIAAGASALVTVVGVDLYGNRYTAGDTSFEALLSGPLTCTGVSRGATTGGCSFVFGFSSDVDGVGKGWTSASFIVTQSGRYTLTLSLTEVQTRHTFPNLQLSKGEREREERHRERQRIYE